MVGSQSFRLFPDGVPATGGVVRFAPVSSGAGAVGLGSMAPSGVLHVAVGGPSVHPQEPVSSKSETTSGIPDNEGSCIVLSQDNFVIDAESDSLPMGQQEAKESDASEEGIGQRPRGVVRFAPGTKTSDGPRRVGSGCGPGLGHAISERDRRARLYDAIFEQDEELQDVFGASTQDAGRVSKRMRPVVLRGHRTGQDEDSDSSGMSLDGCSGISRCGSVQDHASGEVDLVGGLRSTEGMRGVWPLRRIDCSYLANA